MFMPEITRYVFLCVKGMFGNASKTNKPSWNAKPLIKHYYINNASPR